MLQALCIRVNFGICGVYGINIFRQKDNLGVDLSCAKNSGGIRREIGAADSASKKLDESLKAEISSILAEDPRPGYQDDPGRIYTFKYADFEVSFKSENGAITVTDII
jgi:hypothetical protein